MSEKITLIDVRVMSSGLSHLELGDYSIKTESLCY